MSPLRHRECRWCKEVRDICPDCERRAEDRADPYPEHEPLDRWGRDPDWHWPRS